MQQSVGPEPDLGARRLDLCPSAVVIRLAEPEREAVVYLTEMSASAADFVGDQDFAVAELICIELPHHLLLADVRRCEKIGNQFTSKATRISTLPKTAARNRTTNAEKIEALVADLHLQCQVQLSIIEASIAGLDASSQKKRSGAPHQSREVPSANPRAVSDNVDTAAAFPASNWNLSLPASACDTAAPSEAVAKARPEVSQEPEVQSVPSANTRNSDASPIVKPVKDAEPKTFGEHMTLFGAPAPRRSIGGRASLIYIAAALGLVIAGNLTYDRWKPVASELAALFSGSRSETPAAKNPLPAPSNSASPNVPAVPADAPEPPASSGDDSPPRAISAGAHTEQPSDSDTKKQEPVPNASIVSNPLREAVHKAPGDGARLHASVRATGMSWVSVCSDGKERFHRLFNTGDSQDITFSKLALVRLGNGPAIEVALEGQVIDTLSAPSVRRAIELRADGARFIGYGQGSRACGNLAAAVPAPSQPLAEAP